jgi:hypothetical protein
MRKVLLVFFVGFTSSVFAVSSIAQRRGRRGRGGAAATQGGPPNSPQIAQELGAMQWGMSHDQVVDYYRRAITARYQPLLRNKGQVEQDRLMQDRDREIQNIRQSYIQFNGQQNQRRWDTSFVGTEYTHGNNESMLVYEDEQTGNREFFFFFNDRLWKRFQARAVPRGSGLDYAGFVGRIEQLFGRGLHINDPERPDRLMTVAWQDGNTRLHLIDNSTFYNAFCLVYEDRATLARLADLRHNAPTKQQTTARVQLAAGEPHVGNVEGDPNADIVDRITGKMRHTQEAPSGTGASAGGSAGASTGSTGGSSTTRAPTNTNGNNGPSDDDPLRGL